MFRASMKNSSDASVRLGVDLSSGRKIAKRGSDESSPLLDISRIAQKYDADLYISGDTGQANLKSPSKVANLGLTVDDVVTISGSGKGYSEAVQDITNYLRGPQPDEQLLYDDEYEGVFSILRNPIEESDFERKLKGKD